MKFVLRFALEKIDRLFTFPPHIEIISWNFLRFFFWRLTKGIGFESESQIIRLVMCVTLVHNTRNIGCENEKPKQNKA